MNVKRFSIQPLGPARSEQEIRDAVNSALQESLQRINQEMPASKVRAEIEPEGAFLGAAAAGMWLLKVVAGAAAGEATKRLVGYVMESLRKRNLNPGEPSTAGVSKEQEKAQNKRHSKDKKAPGNTDKRSGGATHKR